MSSSRVRFYGIIGPNGAGKSTLLLTLAGELEPCEGEVTFHGDGIILCIADPLFYQDTSVAEHLRLLGIDNAEYLDTWQLEHLLPHPPMWLSSGQRQRIYLAAQLAVPAAVVLIDEPERHLDAEWVEFLCEQLRRRAASSIVIVASHSSDVLSACDELIQLG